MRGWHGYTNDLDFIRETRECREENEIDLGLREWRRGLPKGCILERREQHQREEAGCGRGMHRRGSNVLGDRSRDLGHGIPMATSSTPYKPLQYSL